VLFQQYADQHWSVVRYAQWINREFSGNYRNGILINGATLSTSPSTLSDPWNYVDWKELNLTEEDIGASVTNSGFSHRIDVYGAQQYYEMIGKYPQFAGGWDDADSFKPNGAPYTKSDIQTELVSTNFLKYRDMRGAANSSYNIATTISYILVANHILSALEAAWNAGKINHRIQLQGHIQSRRVQGSYTEFVPTLKFSYEM
jgi:hypothetical protein